jgi:DNA invertase Pin-like site-specific DNA recombinase
MATKLDRLTRSVRDAHTLIERSLEEGWHLVITEMGLDFTTPTGRLVGRILADFAEFERELISERVKAVAQRIVRERERGNSVRFIAEDLTADGVLSPAGKPGWQASTARRIYERHTRQDKETAA